MQNTINLLRKVISTMDTIPVTGIDNQDKFVGCANAVQAAVTRLEQLASQPQERAALKEEAPDGR